MCSARQMANEDAPQPYFRVLGIKLSVILAASAALSLVGAAMCYKRSGTNLLSMYLVWATGFLIAEVYAFLSFSAVLRTAYLAKQLQNSWQFCLPLI